MLWTDGVDGVGRSTWLALGPAVIRRRQWVLSMVFSNLISHIYKILKILNEIEVLGIHSRSLAGMAFSRDPSRALDRPEPDPLW